MYVHIGTIYIHTDLVCFTPLRPDIIVLYCKLQRKTEHQIQEQNITDTNYTQCDENLKKREDISTPLLLDVIYILAYVVNFNSLTSMNYSFYKVKHNMCFR